MIKASTSISTNISGQFQPEYTIGLSDFQLGIILNALRNPNWIEIPSYEKDDLKCITRVLSKLHGTKPSEISV